MRTYNADGTQKINSDCAEKNSRNVSSMFDEKKRRKKQQNSNSFDIRAMHNKARNERLEMRNYY